MEDEDDPLYIEREAFWHALKSDAFGFLIIVLATPMILNLNSCYAATILLPSGEAVIESGTRTPSPTVCLPSGTAWICS